VRAAARTLCEEAAWAGAARLQYLSIYLCITARGAANRSLEPGAWRREPGAGSRRVHAYVMLPYVGVLQRGHSISYLHLYIRTYIHTYVHRSKIDTATTDAPGVGSEESAPIAVVPLPENQMTSLQHVYICICICTYVELFIFTSTYYTYLSTRAASSAAPDAYLTG